MKGGRLGIEKGERLRVVVVVVVVVAVEGDTTLLVSAADRSATRESMATSCWNFALQGRLTRVHN